MDEGRLRAYQGGMRVSVAAMAFFCGVGLGSIGLGEVWQWSLKVQNAVDRGEGPPVAFLWIPPQCREVRAVIVGQNNMEEEPILEDAAFREAMGQLNVAEIWTTPAFSPFFPFNKGAGEVLVGMINDLASESGYDELRFAPIIGIG